MKDSTTRRVGVKLDPSDRATSVPSDIKTQLNRKGTREDTRGVSGCRVSRTVSAMRWNHPYPWRSESHSAREPRATLSPVCSHPRTASAADVRPRTQNTTFAKRAVAPLEGVQSFSTATPPPPPRGTTSHVETRWPDSPNEESRGNLRRGAPSTDRVVHGRRDIRQPTIRVEATQPKSSF
jgi:hypothetical protein